MGYDSVDGELEAVERYPKMPVVVTAYSMKECEMDEDCERGVRRRRDSVCMGSGGK